MAQIEVTASIVVRDVDRVLFVRDPIGQGAWSLPGGALQPYEDPTDAAARILRECLGSQPGALRLDHARSRRVPTGSWQLDFRFECPLAAQALARRGAAEDAVRWFPLSRLPALVAAQSAEDDPVSVVRTVCRC